MQYMKLGRSGLDISPVAIGCMGFGDPGHGYPTWSINEEASRILGPKAHRCENVR